MIQRVQSFWLVLAVCGMALCFMFPTAKYAMTLPTTGQKVEASLELVGQSEEDTLNQLGMGEQVVKYNPKLGGIAIWPLVVLALLTGVLALVGLFLYSNRVRQMRVVMVAFLCSVAYVFVVFIWAVDAYGEKVAEVMRATDLEVEWGVGAIAPIVSVVLLVLAYRGIRRDEAKVRAADRLR